MPIARLFVERYEKRHLAAQVRSANGLRGIFKFSEILGSPRMYVYVRMCLRMYVRMYTPIDDCMNT